MNPKVIELYSKLLIFLLVLVLWGTFSLIILRQKITMRQRIFILLTFLPFVVLGLTLAATILTQNIIFLTLAFLSIFPILILLGAIQLLFSKDAEALYEFLRNKGGLWRWLVPALPKRENYLLKGILLILIGMGFTLFLIISFFLN